jgi:hypothetical protein
MRTASHAREAYIEYGIMLLVKKNPPASRGKRTASRARRTLARRRRRRAGMLPTSKQSKLPCSGGDKVLFQYRHGDEKSRRR